MSIPDEHSIFSEQNFEKLIKRDPEGVIRAVLLELRTEADFMSSILTRIQADGKMASARTNLHFTEHLEGDSVKAVADILASSNARIIEILDGTQKYLIFKEQRE